MTKLLSCFFLFCLVGTASSVLAHGDESHEDEGNQSKQHAVSDEPAGVDQMSSEVSVSDDAAQGHGGEHAQSSGPGITLSGVIGDLTWSEFPTLHPMIVHVPVTLIPLAFVLALIGLFAAQRTFLWLAFAFAAIGLAGGLIAAFPTHPHTQGLPDAARLTLEKHDFFAYTTLWLTAFSVAVALLCIWKPVRLSRIALALVLLLASLSVALTGHYGGTLAYVHGIGSQGRFLSTH